MGLSRNRAGFMLTGDRIYGQLTEHRPVPGEQWPENNAPQAGAYQEVRLRSACLKSET